MFYKPNSEYLKDLRLSQFMDQPALGEKIDLTPTTICRIEKGQRMSGITLHKYADYFTDADINDMVIRD